MSAVCVRRRILLPAQQYVQSFNRCNAAKMVVHAFISSHVDYYNSLLYGISYIFLISRYRPYTVQDFAARLITSGRPSQMNCQLELRSRHQILPAPIIRQPRVHNFTSSRFIVHSLLPGRGRDFGTVCPHTSVSQPDLTPNSLRRKLKTYFLTNVLIFLGFAKYKCLHY